MSFCILTNISIIDITKYDISSDFRAVVYNFEIKDPQTCSYNSNQEYAKHAQVPQRPVLLEKTNGQRDMHICYHTEKSLRLISLAIDVSSDVKNKEF